MSETVTQAGISTAARIRSATAVLGPTNTGKTHLAIERMLTHESGLIGLPLRLLAREVYDRISTRVGKSNVALITGEEKIKPEMPKFYVCTVEAMPRDIDVDFVAIDEIQLAADEERGHVFTHRLLFSRGRLETLFLGAATMRDLIADMLPGTNFISRPRLSKLTFSGYKKISRLPRRSAIVSFSSSEVYTIAELIRRQRGGAAVVLGALSPRTRNAQVEIYQSGDVDFLIATDAIGMGLNLDVDHVAFAATRKFDGQHHRELRPAEIGQIAGRAGRYLNDGTFGVTSDVKPFDSELITRLENHQFEPVRQLQWRNHDLEFASLGRLKESLRAAPTIRNVVRARMADDVIALENVSEDPDVLRVARSPAAVRLLWDACQIPDYRKISPANHAELIANIYKFLVGTQECIPEDWFAEQVERDNRTDGDIDTLSNRLANIRTWKFVANHSTWLRHADHWQERTAGVEDALSDALHEQLTARFVDKRTSVLMRRLRDDEEMFAEIEKDGSIHVEKHYVGKLDGFHFSPDTSSDGVHGKAARHAANQVLIGELAMRTRRLVAAKSDAFSLANHNSIVWNGSVVAYILRGETLLKPLISLVVDEILPENDRRKIHDRIQAWLDEIISTRLKPLVDLRDASDISGYSKGVAFRLVESLGIIPREKIQKEIKELDQPGRQQLRKYGVRFGAFNIYLPLLLKPAASELLQSLWITVHREELTANGKPLPVAPRAGLTSVVADSSIPEDFYRIAGYRKCGSRAVRIDILERLADMIRPLVSWRQSPSAPSNTQRADRQPNGTGSQAGSQEGQQAELSDTSRTEISAGLSEPSSGREEAATVVGGAGDDLITQTSANVSEDDKAPSKDVSEDANSDREASAEGAGKGPAEEDYSRRAESKAHQAGAGPARRDQPPVGSTGDGGFRITPDMMSILGCSNAEVGSVLASLGFRVERRAIAVPAADASDDGANVAVSVSSTGMDLKSAGSDVSSTTATATTEKQPAVGSTTRFDERAGLAASKAEQSAKPDSERADKSGAGLEESNVLSPRAEPSEQLFDEIWRPRRRYEGSRQGKSHRRASVPANRGKRPDNPRGDITTGGTSPAATEDNKSGRSAGRGDRERNRGKAFNKGRPDRSERSNKAGQGNNGDRQRRNRADKSMRDREQPRRLESRPPEHLTRKKQGVADPTSPFAILARLKDEKKPE